MSPRNQAVLVAGHYAKYLQSNFRTVHHQFTPPPGVRRRQFAFRNRCVRAATQDKARLHDRTRLPVPGSHGTDDPGRHECGPAEFLPR